MDEVTQALVGELGDSAAALPRMPTRTGRSGSGRLRNFKAMNDEKFEREAAFVLAENNDAEAIEVVRAEQARRGIG